MRDGAEAAYSRGEVETRDGQVLVEVEIPTQGREPRAGEPVDRSGGKRDLRRQVRAVFFGPDDLDRDRRPGSIGVGSWTRRSWRSGR